MRCLVLWIAAVAACGGGQVEVVGHVNLGASSRAIPRVEDQRIVMESTELLGQARAPAAIARPAWPASAGPSKMSLDAARARASRATRTDSDVKRLATLLWVEASSKSESDPDGARELLAEADEYLEDFSGDDSNDDVALAMRAAVLTQLGKLGAAAKLYKRLAKRAGPQDVGRYLVWKAFVALRERNAADALAALQTVNLAEAPPEAAYIAAWAAYLRGDDDGARFAIATALSRWSNPESRSTVEDEMLLLFAATGTTVDKMAEALGAAADGDAKKVYRWLFTVSELYSSAGYYEHAAASLLHALERTLPDGAVPPEDVVGFRFRRADYGFRSDDPQLAANEAIEAHRALAGCGDPCDADTIERVTGRISRLAQFYHTSYAASLDPRHHEAALKLYDYYLSIPKVTQLGQTRTLRANLEDTKANANPANGRHDETILSTLGQARRETLLACYERVLAVDPTVSGPLKIIFEIEATGTVIGSSSEPAPGLEGSAAVAECVTRRVRRWRFPARSVPGTTVVELSVQLTNQ